MLTAPRVTRWVDVSPQEFPHVELHCASAVGLARDTRRFAQTTEPGRLHGFDQVAARYDITNDVLGVRPDACLGAGHRGHSEPNLDDRILDLAAGTGRAPFRLNKRAPLQSMRLQHRMFPTRGSPPTPELPFTAGDALNRLLADDTFDAVTISFTFGGVTWLTPKSHFAKCAESLRPGGRLVIGNSAARHMNCSEPFTSST